MRVEVVPLQHQTIGKKAVSQPSLMTSTTSLVPSYRPKFVSDFFTLFAHLGDAHRQSGLLSWVVRLVRIVWQSKASSRANEEGNNL